MKIDLPKAEAQFREAAADGSFSVQFFVPLELPQGAKVVALGLSSDQRVVRDVPSPLR